MKITTFANKSCSVFNFDFAFKSHSQGFSLLVYSGQTAHSRITFYSKAYSCERVALLLLPLGKEITGLLAHSKLLVCPVL